MITAQLNGGLGNQLFQVFNLISYCLDNNNNYVLEKYPILYGPIRNYNVYWNNIFKNIENNCKEIAFNFPIWSEKGFTYNKIPYFKPNLNIKLSGYFQSYKYFHHNFNKISTLLQLSSLKNNIRTLHQLDYNNIISLHFRVGDYAKLQQHHPLMTPDYYIKALKTIIEKTNKNNWKILYFCEKDDMEYVNIQINLIKEKFTELEFIMCNHKLQDWEQMLQMSLCKHNIIANSTFSWWSAYLNNNKDKIVCISQKWFGPKIKHNTTDLYVPEWIIIRVGK